MSNRILKAPLVAVTGLLAMAAIPAVAQAGGGTYPTPRPGDLARQDRRRDRERG